MTGIRIEQEQAELLRDSETWLRPMLESVEAGVFSVDLDGNCAFVNRAALKLLGFRTPSDLLGKKIHALIHHTRRNGDPCPETDCNIYRAAREGLVFHVEDEILCRSDGTSFEVEYWSSPIRRDGTTVGAVATFVDITKRRQAEQALRESEELYRALFANAGAGIVFVDASGRILRANDAFVDFIGYSPEELAELSPGDVSHPLDRKATRDRIEEVFKGERSSARMEKRYLTKNGSVVSGDVRLAPVRSQTGEITAVMAVIVDITSRIKAERALRESEERFKAQYKSIPIPTYTWRRDGDDFVLIDYNDAADEITRGKISQLLGQKSRDLYADAPDVYRNILRCLVSKRPIKNEMWFRLRTTHKLSYFGVTYAYVPPDLVMVHTDDITDRKRAQEALRESEKKYRQLVETLQEGIWVIDKDASTTFVNPAMARMLGYQVDEMLGRHLFSFMDERAVEISKRNLERRRQGIKEQHDFEFIRKDGSRVYASMQTSPILDDQGNYDGALAGVMDITERRRTELALRQAYDQLEIRVNERTAELQKANRELHKEVAERRRTEGVLKRRDAILEAVAYSAGQFLKARSWRESIEGVLRRIGEAARVSRTYVFENHADQEGTLFTRQRYEWTAPGIVAQIDNPDLRDVPLRQMGFMRWIETLGAGGVIHGYPRHFPKAEREVLSSQGILSMVVAPVFVADHWWGFIGFDECLVEREWVPAEIDALKALADILGVVILREQAREQARQHQAELAHVARLSTMGEMATAMAHELNQPLTAINTFADTSLRMLAAKDTDSEELKEALEGIGNQAVRAGEIIRRLRQFVTKQAPQKKSVDLNALVRDAVGFIERDAQAKSVGVRLELAKDLPLVSADAIQIEQVILNLMRNGIEAMEHASVKNRELSIRTIGTAGKGAVRVSVEDTGPGFDQEALNRLFAPFVTTKPTGMGMGLSISRSIIESHGGRLWAESKPGHGAKFIFTIPISVH
jgi:PAS domain S-box-containing protein